MVNENLLEGLNERQKEAVITTEGYVCVIAGAGSGKTKTLAHRYAYLVNEVGVSPSNILCVTFTNKAAYEMKNRVRKLVDMGNVNDFICTYHGFCVKVLREDIHKIGYPASYVIMDKEDQKTILREIYEELGLKQTVLTFKQVLTHIARQKYSGSYVEDYIDINSARTDEQSPIIDAQEECFVRYVQKQRKAFMLDFDDLMLFTVYIFHKYQDILQKWQHRLDYIMVDETQDNSTTQWKFVDMLQEGHKNLFVVGDPDQCIYEWRGAKPSTLVQFDNIYSPCKTIILNQNYRSTPNILDVANSVIANNQNRIAKDLFTSKQKMSNVTHFHGKSEVEEGDYIAQIIIKHIKSGGHASDIAILFRASHVSRFIEQALMRHKLPYVVYGGIRFFERQEVKDVLAYLRMVDTGDDLSFRRIINQPRRKLGKVFMAALNEIAEHEKVTLYEGLKMHIKSEGLNKPGAVEFIQLIESAREAIKDLTISDAVQYVLEKSGLMEFYRTDGDEDRLSNIRELLDSIQLYEKSNENEENLSLTGYLQDIALFTNLDYKEEKDSVKIMTIHQAKGLEFPVVFVAGMNEGTFPSYRTIRERKRNGLEEERRLAYVAYTRAENELYLTESEGFNFESSGEKYPSRFIFEIKEKQLVREGGLTKELEKTAQIFIQESERQMDSAETAESITIGTHVKHRLFGRGKVVQIDKDKRTIEVLLDDSNDVKHFSVECLGSILTIENG